MGSVWGTGEGTTWVPSNRFFLFSVFLCDFRVFRVMMFTSEESPTRNRSTSKEFRLSKSDSVHGDGGRKTTAGVLEGFAPGIRLKERRKTPLPQYIRRRRGAQNDRGCTRRLRPVGLALGEGNGSPRNASLFQSLAQLRSSAFRVQPAPARSQISRRTRSHEICEKEHQAQKRREGADVQK